MGFWSGLLKGAAGIVGAPFTGGASLAMLPSAIGDFVGSGGEGEGEGEGEGGIGWGNAIGAGLSTAGNMAKGREAGRQSEFQNSVIRNQQDLRQRDFANESQSDAYHKAMISALGMNVQDASITRPAGVPDTAMRGGLRPSALGTEGRAAAGMLHGKAMERLQNGEKFDKLADTKGNWIDTALGTAGMIGGGLDNYGARQSADEQNSLIRDLLKSAGVAPPPENAGSAGSVTAQTVPPPGATPVAETWQLPGAERPAPKPSVETSWTYQPPDMYGVLPPDFTHGIGGQGGYGPKPSIWGNLFGPR
jgi:hypothetical protein